MKKETFTFAEHKTFFGLTVYRHGVKRSDIAKLPFYKFWSDSAMGSAEAMIDSESYVYLHDWERFCYSFILYGKHRYQ